MTEIQFPEQLKGKSLPDVLLPYQQALSKELATNQVVICEKSRRVGITWGMGSDAVLNAAASKSAGGMNAFYIGYNFDMAREFIDVCAMWAKAFNQVASEVEEFIFEETDADGDKRAIKAFRINFDSGFEIAALSSKPRSLRGRQGLIIIDEAAFHDDLEELMKAALAMLIWGGKILVISTHDGVDNAFNRLIQDAHAGRNKYKVFKVDFNQALKQGLYERICYITDKEWSKQAEIIWRQDIIDFYGDGADEELFCVPKKSSGTYFPGLLVESRMTDAPVIRYECNEQFVHKPVAERKIIVSNWCSEVLESLLKDLDPKYNSFLGEDFGRSGDLTCLHPVQVMQNLERHTPFTVELRNVPFDQQRQIVWFIIDHLPRFCGAAFDARGNGQQLAEDTADRYGHNRIHQVMITRGFYAEAFPPYKAALEDALFDLPRDADVLADHRAAVMVSGIAQIPDKRGKGADGGKRHGDSLIAAVMAHWATIQEIVEYGYHPVDKTQNDKSKYQEFVDDDDDYPESSNGLFEGGTW